MGEPFQLQGVPTPDPGAEVRRYLVLNPAFSWLPLNHESKISIMRKDVVYE